MILLGGRFGWRFRGPDRDVALERWKRSISLGPTAARVSIRYSRSQFDNYLKHTRDLPTT